MRDPAQYRAHAVRVEDLFRNLHEEARGEIATCLIGGLDREAARKLASGRKDLFGSISTVRPSFFELLARRGDDLGLTLSDLGDRVFAEALFQCALKSLRDDGLLVFANDRLRARGRNLEVVHYLRNLRQRTTRGEKQGGRPELVEMAKVEVLPRERPIRLEESPADFVSRVNDLEFEDPLDLDEDFPLSECLDQVQKIFSGFLRRAFARFSVAPFQALAFERLLTEALTGEVTEEAGAFVIAAGTGFGKTEAFLFPILFYAAYSHLRKAKVRGRGKRGNPDEWVDAFLLYPRRDLCDNQAERVLRYLLHLNRAYCDVTRDSEFRPIRVAVAHSDAEQLRIRCPMCEEEKANQRPWTEEDETRSFIVAQERDGSFGGVDGFRCQRRGDDHAEAADCLVYQAYGSSRHADIIVTTVDTLHRRLMDDHGQKRVFGRDVLPRFVVLDEMHIYEGQSGSHAANILRRCRQRIRSVGDHSDEIQGRAVFVGASATAGQPTAMGARMFGVKERDVELIQPGDEERREQGLEYFIFLRSPGNRIAAGRGMRHRSEAEIEDDAEGNGQSSSRFVSEQATMIQAAFCLQHTMRAPSGQLPAKRRTLGFVDSIDVAQRLAGNIHDPEWATFATAAPRALPLYALRYPAGRPRIDLVEEATAAAREFWDREMQPRLDDDPRDLAGLGSGCPKRATRDCDQPPHHILERCSRYEEGECWFTSGEPREEGLRPFPVQLRRSGHQAWGEVGRRWKPEDRDRWRLLVATSTLEVGFDHHELIATWQYHAPPSVASFVQRKGRGGRGVRDFPVTMLVLGPSPSDSYYFQNHLRLVRVHESDIVSYVDEENPLIRSQHIVSAVFDYSAATGRKLYYGPDFDTLRAVLEGSEVRDWIRATYPEANRVSTDRTLKELREYLRSEMNAALVPEPSRSGRSPDRLTPAILLSLGRDSVVEYRTRIQDRLGRKATEGERNDTSRSLQWATSVLGFLSARQERKPRRLSAVDLCEIVPRDFEQPDLRVPASTIPEPLGRHLTAWTKSSNGDDELLGQEPAEFLLRTFLPGGFKIRYKSRLWKAPWKSVRGKPPEGNRVWVETRGGVIPGPPGDLPEDLYSLLNRALVGSDERRRLEGLLTTECRVLPITGVKLEDCGAGRSRSFQLQESLLQIHTRKPSGVSDADLTHLVRDPHLTSCRFVLVWKRDPRPRYREYTDRGPLESVAYHRDLRLVVGHYGNLVHCYPKSDEVRTLSVQFWDEESSRPLCVVVPQRAEALEVRCDPDSILRVENWSGTPRTLAFWRRVETQVLEVLVGRDGVIPNAYLIPGIVQALRWLEIERRGRIGSFVQEAPSGAELQEAAARVRDRRLLAATYRRELEIVSLVASRLSEVLSEAATWSNREGRWSVIGDSLAAALTRVAGTALGVSPGSLRRLVEIVDSRLHVFLYDDFEGGGGNSRRLFERFEEWTSDHVLRALLDAADCPAAAGDQLLNSVFDSDVSPDALSAMVTGGVRLPGIPGDDQRTLARVGRLLESPEIAAFNHYAFKARRALRERLGGEPPLPYFLDYVSRHPALDPRAEALRVQFLEDGGDAPELPARLQEVAPLCVASCPECLDFGGFHTKSFADRPFLKAVLQAIRETHG